jgi:Leucine-rich repeat (LRR) protein
MVHLQKLTLHHNNFGGEVPEELCDLRDDGDLHFLWVDCSPMPSTNLPKVFCPIDSCCTICFEGEEDDDDTDADGGGPIAGPDSTGADASSSSSSSSSSHVVTDDASSELKLLLSGASSDDGAALNDIHSPQFRAYAWLVADVSYAGGYVVDRLFQRYALATLYFATGGPHWLNSDKWISLLNECDWHGLHGCQDATLNGNAINSIDLGGNGLKGTIPPEIFGFQELSSLFLAENELSGPIPSVIGKMSNVATIDLGENQLTSMPSEMGNLNTVEHLFLQGNDFGSQSMPDEVCDLRKSGSLTLLWADCKQCHLDCCTTCFSGWSTNGETFNTSDVSISQADLDGKLLASLKEMSHGE